MLHKLTRQQGVILNTLLNAFHSVKLCRKLASDMSLSWSKTECSSYSCAMYTSTGY